MKKRSLLIILSLTLVVALTGCGANTTNSVAEEQQEVTDLEDNASEITSDTADLDINKVSDDENSSNETVEEKSTVEFTTLNFGDTISNDFIEMTINSASTSQELLPTDTSSVYSYMSDKDNETYFYIMGNIKNVGGDSYSVEDMNIQFTFDNKYNYTGYIAADDGGNDFYGDHVKPFGTVKYYMYASVPDELINSYSTCKVQFAFHENCEHDYKTDFSLYEYCYEINLTK
jgi:hypothetical protein